MIVWGGDGTVNEAGSVLMGSPTALGLVPAGSGNGLAAALGVSRDPAAALADAFDAPAHRIDAGVMAGRPFFNIAGVGFDARVAALFNQRAAGSRGAWPYIAIGVREGCRYCAVDYTLTLDAMSLRSRALLVAFANGREYGIGARIAPDARAGRRFSRCDRRGRPGQHRPAVLGRAAPGDRYASAGAGGDAAAGDTRRDRVARRDGVSRRRRARDGP